MSDVPSKPSDQKQLGWQFSLRSLLVFTTICCVVFTSYHLVLPLWPAEWPRWTLFFFTVWTGAAVGQMCFCAWCWVLAYYVSTEWSESMARHVPRAVLWGVAPTSLWLTFLAQLLLTHGRGDVGEFFTGIWALAAVHFCPLAIFMSVRAVRLAAEGVRFPLYMAWFCGAATALLPTLAIACYLVADFDRLF